MAKRTIAIGDIHGCHAALACLLKAISPSADDLIVTLGDYVDRGPDSPAVLDELIRLKKICRLETIMGNHELMMLAAMDSQLEFWLASGGRPTYDSYGSDLANVPDAHLEFVNSCRSFLELEDFFFVHANYTPTVPLNRQPEYALYWEHLHAYLPERHLSGKTAIVGHTPQRDGEVYRLDHLICIDTYCYGGGWLTAIELQSDTIWQADMDGRLRNPTRP